MKFIVTRSSIWSSDKKPIEETKRELDKNDNVHWTIEINSLEELVVLSTKYNWRRSGETEGIIVKGNTIEIYDDYNGLLESQLDRALFLPLLLDHLKK